MRCKAFIKFQASEVKVHANIGMKLSFQNIIYPTITVAIELSWLRIANFTDSCNHYNLFSYSVELKSYMEVYSI